MIAILLTTQTKLTQNHIKSTLNFKMKLRKKHVSTPITTWNTMLKTPIPKTRTKNLVGRVCLSKSKALPGSFFVSDDDFSLYVDASPCVCVYFLNIKEKNVFYQINNSKIHSYGGVSKPIEIQVLPIIL